MRTLASQPNRTPRSRTWFAAPVVALALVSLTIGTLARHSAGGYPAPPFFHLFFSDTLHLKAWLATAVSLLALFQLLTAARVFDVFHFRPSSRFWGRLHRLSGYLAIGLTLPVAYCHFPKGFPQRFLKIFPPPRGHSPLVLFYPVMSGFRKVARASIRGPRVVRTRALGVSRHAFDEVTIGFCLSPGIGLFPGPAPALGRPESAGRAEARPLHHDLMGPVGEAIQGAVGEDGIVEQGDPLIDGAIARDDGGGMAVAYDEDIVEVARLLRGELAEAEVVEGEQIRREPRAQLAFEGVIRAGLAEGEQELGDFDEAHAVAGAAGAIAQRFGKPTLPDTDGAAEDDVLLGGEPVEAKEFADAGAVVVYWRLPDEVVVGDDFIEAGGLHAHGQALAVATVNLVLEEQLEKLQMAEFGLARVRGAIRERGHQAAQAEALSPATPHRSVAAAASQELPDPMLGLNLSAEPGT